MVIVTPGLGLGTPLESHSSHQVAYQTHNVPHTPPFSDSSITRGPVLVFLSFGLFLVSKEVRPRVREIGLGAQGVGMLRPQGSLTNFQDLTVDLLALLLGRPRRRGGLPRAEQTEGLGWVEGRERGDQ